MKNTSVDQMVQAARSGVQNIAEGSAASGTSKQTEIKLTSVARASLTELQMDYEDFLRQTGLALWTKDSASALAVRRQLWRAGRLDVDRLMEQSPEIIANTMICRIHQTCYLLAHQLRSLELRFAQSGGIREDVQGPSASARGRLGRERSPFPQRQVA